MLPERDAWGERLPRHLGLWSAVAVLIGSTIGSGIFRVPASVAERLQSPGPVLLAWIVGGVIVLFGALTLAELAGALPRSGGVFAYILEAFGPMPAFLFGWSELTVIRASALGAIATIFAEYLGRFILLTPMQVRWVAAAAVIAVGLLNYLGVNRAAVLMNLATVAKYGALAILVILAFAAGQGSTAHFTPAWSSGINLSLIATALIAIMWTYDGWADLSPAQPRVYLPGAAGSDGPLSPDRRDGSGADTLAWSVRRCGDFGRGHGLLLQHPDRIDDDRTADLLCHGRPRPLLP